MGVLTETMTRLREEIGGWQHAREGLGAARVRETTERRGRVSTLCAGFARDRAGAQRAWAGRTPAPPTIQKPAARPPVEPSRPSQQPQSKKAKKH